jgi:N-acetylmuramoyl-L-alanine amidase
MPDQAEIYRHEVRFGECFSSIAEDHGFTWKSLWDLPENGDLRKLRKDPNVLFPGDVVAIPALRQRHESCSTDKRHIFRRTGTPAKLVMRFVEDGEPLSSEDYILIVDGVARTGKLDGNGVLNVKIKPNARKVTLTIGEDDPMDIKLGSLDPVDTVSGVQGRLANLNFHPGPIDNIMGPATEAAIKAFQRRMHMKPTGEIDNSLQQRLKEEHGS